MSRKRIFLFLAAFLLIGLFCVQMVAAATDGWAEYADNPVFAPGDTNAYYPCVLYDANQFSSHGDTYYYKMWYDTGSSIRLAYSNDGVNWVEQGSGDLSTLTNARHPVVIYNANGFGDGMYYEMWYWNSAGPYTDPIRCAESSDGINWVNDQAITQDPSAPLVAGWVAPYWFYGSYGAGAVLYNPAGYATINYADPMGNKYVMYYDADSEGFAPIGTEGTALAFSADGIYWARYGSEPVLLGSGGSAWDSNYAYAWSVLKINGQYEMWYSGGQAGSSEGIGYAQSSDGITWTKQADPVMHMSDGVAWRSDRTYTPSVIYDANQFSGHGDTEYLKMWYSGVSGSSHAVGFASCNINLFVTPENPIGIIAALLACAAAVAVFKLQKNPIKR